MSNRIVVLGLDGATWTQFDKFTKLGMMPNLEKIIKLGVKSQLNSLFPFTSGASWTSMFTGVNPGKHGIPHHIVGGRCEMESIWQILSDKKSKCLVVNDVITYPPDEINGIMISGGFSTPPNSKNFCHPPEINHEINQVVENYFPSLATEIFERVQKGDFEYFFKKLEQYGNNISKIALNLSQKYEWEIFSTVLENTDYLHHFFWNKQDYLERFYVWLDDIIEKFYQTSIKNNANLFLVSDHGFGPINKYFLINSWLKENKLSDFEEPGKIRKQLANTSLKRNSIRKGLDKFHIRKIVSRLTPNEFKKMIPNADIEYAIIQKDSKIFSEAYNEIIVKETNKERHEKICDEIISNLLELEDEGNKVVLKALKKEETFDGPYVDRAYDIQLLLNEGYCWAPAIREKSIIDRDEFNKARTGDHRPEGIFLGVGPDIQQNKILNKPLTILDISPMILHLFGYEIPEYMDGKVIKEIFDHKSKAFSESVKTREKTEKEQIRDKINQKRNKLKI